MHHEMHLIQNFNNFLLQCILLLFILHSNISWPHNMDRVNKKLERVWFGLGSLLGLVVSLGCLYLLCVEPEPKRTVGDTIGSMLQWEFFIALLGFSVMTLSWSITGSERIEDLAGKASGKALLLLALWLVVGVLCGILFGI